jgi:hypothetical protein
MKQMANSPSPLLTKLEQVQNFDALPADAIVPVRVSRLVRNVSEWTDRRLEQAGSPLVPKRVLIGERRFGHRVGDIRAIVRGEVAA